MKLFLPLVIVITLSSTAFAQNELSGHVLDSLTRKPVPFASVFFANTTVGVSTNEAGEFSLKNFSSGKYDLVVSFVGYKTVMASINFENSKEQIEILLPQQVTQLDEVLVSPDTSHRASNMREFIRTFLGESKNASDCRIINQKDIYLYFDPSDKLLTAASKKPIEIENKALGYKLIYQLESFAIDYANSRQAFYGLLRFEELTPKNNSTRKRWEKERKRAYEGSFTNFIELLQRGEFNGPFTVHEMFRVPNRNRLPEKKIAERLSYWRNRMLNTDVGSVSFGKVTKDDSLDYYLRQRRMPAEVDSIGRQFTKREELLDLSGKNLTYSGSLRIIYNKEPEEQGFAASNRRAPQPFQVSVVNFLGKGLTLYENGYYEDLRELLFEGYMGWQEKVSEMLPLK